MKVLPGMATSASALTSHKLWLDMIANNLSNINTTGTESGGPYRKKMPVFAERLRDATDADFKGYGVKVDRIVEDKSPPRMVHNPEHPHANEEGYVAMPNISIVNEMVDMITASRAYEANVTVLNASKSLALKALEIGKG